MLNQDEWQDNMHKQGLPQAKPGHTVTLLMKPVCTSISNSGKIYFF